MRHLRRPAGLPHLPRPTMRLRLRLTVVYGGLFLLSGAVLVALSYSLVLHATDSVVTLRGPHGEVVGAVATGGPAGVGRGGQAHTPPTGQVFNERSGLSTGLTPQQAEAQGRRIEAEAIRQHAADLHEFLVQSGVALGVMAVVSIGLGWLVAGRVLRPLRTITIAARDISATSLHRRLALDGPRDELKELGDTIDGLLGRLERSFQSQRQFVANASHELRTPLARQRTLVQVALSDPEPTVESLRAAHERVLVAGEQQERLIEALLTLARGERGLDRRRPLDLRSAAGQVLGPRLAEADRLGLHLHAILDSAPASGDPRLVERLVANLVDNAVRHNVAGGRIEIATGTSAGHAVLTVVNSGPVIPPSEMDRLFQPFQRMGADRTGHADGIGLGLSIVHAIATAHEATLITRPLPEGGLDVEVRFPARHNAGGLDATGGRPPGRGRAGHDARHARSPQPTGEIR
ncbi:MAG TPA: ATP-binding protein [Candidatus Dormibacteraeota bacterium]